jgi:hypothetical protein
MTRRASAYDDRILCLRALKFRSPRAEESGMEPSDKDLQRWLGEWERGERSKSEIEVTEFGDSYSHGKRITKLWRDRLDVETEKKSAMAEELKRVRAELRKAHTLLDKHSIPY